METTDKGRETQNTSSYAFHKASALDWADIPSNSKLGVVP